jgi:hypothetical protein
VQIASRTATAQTVLCASGAALRQAYLRFYLHESNERLKKKKNNSTLDAASKDCQPRDIGPKSRPPAQKAHSRFKLA